MPPTYNGKEGKSYQTVGNCKEAGGKDDFRLGNKMLNEMQICQYQKPKERLRRNL